MNTTALNARRLLCAFASLTAIAAALDSHTIASPALPAAAVVGTGTPASCTEVTFAAALAQGGAITFDCGAAPHTITISALKQISLATSLDGGGKITLSGGNSAPLFQVFSSIPMALSNITLANARGSGGITAIQSFGVLDVQNTRFENNDAGANDGAAISSYGTLTIHDSVFFNNRSGANKEGGAINIAAGAASIARTQFISNSGYYGGALAIIGGDVHIAETVFRQNRGFDGGGLYVAGNVTVTVQSSEFTSNTASYGAGLEIQGALMMTNTTVSGNAANVDGGGIWFLNTTGRSQLNSLTLYGNSAGNEGNALNMNGGTVTVKNSVLAGPAGSSIGVNCTGAGATIDVTNVSTDASCDSAVIIADVKLGPLAANGGFSPSHLPLAGSPLIDAVLTCPATDQRGAARPRGLRCDIGAVEVGPVAILYAPVVARQTAGGFGPFESEPNNLRTEANGPLQSGVNYFGNPNDANDYFSFVVPRAGPVAVTLSGHSGAAVNGLQLQLRDVNDQQVTFVFADPFVINVPNLAPGTYYVRIFYAPPGPYNSNTQYTLRVTYPSP